MADNISNNWDLRVNFSCNDCGSFVPKADELVFHSVNNHCGGKFWWCFLCKKYSSEQKANLLQHMRDKHTFTGDLFSCPVCFKIHSHEEKEIEIHLIRDHWTVKQVQCCKLCTYKCEGSIKQHIENVHKVNKCEGSMNRLIENVYKINKCEDSLNQHIENAHKVNKCVSGCKGKNAVDIFRHIMSTHFPKLDVHYKCPYCDSIFDQENSADQHCLMKHGNKGNDNNICIDIICTLCADYQCAKKETYHKHMKAKHELITLACPFSNCSYSNDKFWKFAAHVTYEHILSREYICAICSTKFSKERSLEQHIEDKHSPFDFQAVCTCSTLFSVGSITKHLEKNHGLATGNFRCKLCGSNLCQSNYFGIHLSNGHDLNFPKGIEELYDED